MKDGVRKKGWVVALLVLFIVGGLAFCGAAEQGESSTIGTTLYVDDDATCPGHGTLTAPYCKIQYAIDNATDGDDIKIASGEYDENIVVDKQLTLGWHGGDINGTDSGIPTINGGGTGVVVLIRASDVIVRELSITNSGKTDLDAGVYVSEGNTNVKILENEITDCYHGIWIKRTAAHDTTHEIRGNIIDNMVRQGILISLSDRNAISDNVVTNCGWYGIHLIDCWKNRVKGNVLKQNEYGLIIDVGVENEVELNTCEENNQWGFLVINAQKTVITNNDFLKNKQGQASWINCIGDKWYHNYWGRKMLYLHVVWGTLRGADMSVPWFKIEINSASSPNVP